jgi:hypothetical protein
MKHTVSLNQSDFYMNLRQMLTLSLYLHSLRQRVNSTILTKPVSIKNKILRINKIIATSTTPRKTEVHIFANKGQQCAIVFPHLKQLVVG